MKSGYVSIIGQPNTGKSSLLNLILDERLSIVTPKAQTTRHKVVGIHNTKDVQIIFLDTPGIHVSTKPLNQFMMEQVNDALEDADVICFMIDISRISASNIGQEIEKELEVLEKVKYKKIIIVFNKIDLVFDKSWEGLDKVLKDNLKKYEYSIVSAKTGFGVDKLLESITAALPEGPAYYPDDIYTEHPVRFLVSEIIREQTFNLMRDEIPYSVTVEIEDYQEQPKIDKIHASIIIERESQKGMIIGNKGQMIKKIGELSRQRIQDLVHKKVLLKLFVKVEKNWTKDADSVKKYI